MTTRTCTVLCSAAIGAVAGYFLFRNNEELSEKSSELARKAKTKFNSYTRRGQSRDTTTEEIDSALDDSFPASDPPSWSGVHV